MNPIRAVEKYTHWLHTQWPAGTIEKLPEAKPDGSTNLPGVYVTGDLTGIPLLKFAARSGADAVEQIASELATAKPADGVDIAIIGGGIAGISAAIAARQKGLSYVVIEASQAFSTIVNFPKGKPIYAYPTEMKLRGGLNIESGVKEGLLKDLEQQQSAAEVQLTPGRVESLRRNGDGYTLMLAGDKTIAARRVIVAIGRSGNFRKLKIPGEELAKVSNRLHDPKDYIGKNVLVVGGGDSALEAAIALTVCGAHVTVAYRKPQFSRPKPENLEKINVLSADPEADLGVENPSSERVTTAAAAWMRENRPAGSLKLEMSSAPVEITEDRVTIQNLTDKSTREIANDAVFSMIGREPPLAFFRRSGIKIIGDRGFGFWASFAACFVFLSFVYLWKGSTSVNTWFKENNWFPFNLPEMAMGSPLLDVTLTSLHEPGFYYTLLYTILIVIFGLRRIAHRKTPYVAAQTTTFMAIQALPLFLLPYFILPLMGAAGWFDQGAGKVVADSLFPIADYGHGREYWRAFGFILAWPLFIWNMFTSQPLWGWLIISVIQTFILIPIIIRYWGKGAYCGWICSCGAMAESLGDKQRHKMPHGPAWNRWNMVGQVILAIAMLLLVLRILSWAGVAPLGAIFDGLLSGWTLFGIIQLNYYQVVDIFLAGTVGFACYFWFSGRVWCRFACPLAALMHIYARFSKFRIFPEKSKCISCNVCTSVCHQGIDIMNFANKGIPMADPQCVRCSACVQQCPTGVLSFGRFGPDQKIIFDKLPASPVRSREVSQ